MRRRLTVFLVCCVIGILVIAVTIDLATMRSIPPEAYRETLREAAVAENGEVFTESSDETTIQLPFLLRVRFPAEPQATIPGWSHPDGTTFHGIKNESGILRAAAQRRQKRVCYVVLWNESADDRSVRNFRRALSKRIPGIQILVKK